MNSALFVTAIFAFANCCLIRANPNEENNAAINYVEEVLGNPEQKLLKLAAFATDWAVVKGLVMRTKTYPYWSSVVEFAPVSLLPTPFPRQAFEKAVAVQEAMQLLYFRVACDFDFLFDAYKDVVKTDKHLRQMVDILKEVHRQGIRQPTTLLIMRADYMLNTLSNSDSVQYEIKQIEVNCGAIGGLGIDRRTTELHQEMLRRVGMNPANAPQNNGDRNLINALHMAWNAYGNSDALMVILSIEKFRYKPEVRNIEYELERLSERKICVEYVSLKAGYEHFKLGEDYSLLYQGKVVGVVYSLMSALGYVADEKEMEARKMIELSTAIKAPSLAVAISSSKKIQQLLALPGTVERFFPDPADADKVKAIRETFAGLWGLEHNDEQTQRVIEDAIQNPSNYVLKPNGECGGNNFYDEALAEKLRAMPTEERVGHILMQKLHPITTKNVFLRPFRIPNSKLDTVVSELGVYGTLLGDMRTRTVWPNANVQSGHLLRTKLAGVNEGGISVGTGVGDSPYLF